MPKASSEYNLGKLFPSLLKEWDYNKNLISPYEVSPYTNKKVYWTCIKCQESWDASIFTRTRQNYGCPYCAGLKATSSNNLVLTHPHVAKQWDYEKNKDRPEEYKHGSGKEKYFKCELGHSTFQIIRVKTRNKGLCSVCSKRRISVDNNLAKDHPLVAAEWNYVKNKDRPEEFSERSHEKRWFKCSKRGHDIFVRIGGRTELYNYLSCYKCNQSTSKEEIYLFYELSLFFDFNEFDKKIFYELDNKTSLLDVDVYIPSHKIAIEYDGSYWHKGKEKKDLEKNKKLESLGITVIRLREYPLNNLGDYSVIVNSKEFKENINKLLLYMFNNFTVIDQQQLLMMR